MKTAFSHFTVTLSYRTMWTCIPLMFISALSCLLPVCDNLISYSFLPWVWITLLKRSIFCVTTLPHWLLKFISSHSSIIRWIIWSTFKNSKVKTQQSQCSPTIHWNITAVLRWEASQLMFYAANETSAQQVLRRWSGSSSLNGYNCKIWLGFR